MIAYESVLFPEPFGPMIACTSFTSTSRSTPFTISVPSSSATWRFSSFSSPTKSSFGRIFSAEKPGLSPRTNLGWILAEEALRPVSGSHDLNGSCDHRGRGRGADESSPQAQRCPQRARPRLRVEAAVGARIALERFEEVVRRIDRLRIAGVL